MIDERSPRYVALAIRQAQLCVQAATVHQLQTRAYARAYAENKRKAKNNEREMRRKAIRHNDYARRQLGLAAVWVAIVLGRLAQNRHVAT